MQTYQNILLKNKHTRDVILKHLDVDISLLIDKIDLTGCEDVYAYLIDHKQQLSKLSKRMANLLDQAQQSVMVTISEAMQEVLAHKGIQTKKCTYKGYGFLNFTDEDQNKLIIQNAMQTRK